VARFDRFSMRSVLKVGLFAVTFALCVPMQASEELHFRVLLDDKEIGHHIFRVTDHAGNQTVDIRAEFDVTFFAIPVYSYAHDNREVWKNGCLSEIISRTDDNGKKFLVEGEAKGGLFSVATREMNRQLQSKCVMTFAYWNREFLQQSRLLNAQTGDYLSVNVDFEGTEPLRVGKDTIPALRYRLRNQEKKLDITVWYQKSSGRWLSLESKVGRGKLIRYLPVSTGDSPIPADEQVAARL